MRDGLGVRAERGGVEIAIVGGLVADPVLGVRRTSLGVAGGRIVAIGRAGNPDTMDGIDVVLDTATAVIDATGMIVTPGRRRPARALALAAGRGRRAGRRADDARDPGLRPGLEPRREPGRGARRDLGGARGAPASTPRCSCARSSARPEPVEAALRAGGGGLKIHEDVGAGPEQIRCALDLADRHDVQLAIHTDGLNEALSVEDTLRGVRRAHDPRVPHRGLRRRPRAGPARARRPRARAHLLDLADGAVRRRAPRPSTSRWCAAVHVLAPGGRAGRLDRAAPPRAARGRWPPRASCTTSA